MTIKQYRELKKQHPDTLLLFRMGDFFECFDDDAKTCAEALGLTITTRVYSDEQTPMAGFPYHYLDTYLAKLISRGFRVAVCEQREA